MKKIFLSWYIPIPKEYDDIIFWKKHEIRREWVTVKKTTFYYFKYMLKNYIFLSTHKYRKKADIQMFDSIIWCFFYDKKKTNIIFIHSYDIGIWWEITIQNCSSKTKIYIIKALEYTFWKYIEKKLHTFDNILVTTYDRYTYLQWRGFKNIIFLPNIIKIAYSSPKKIQSKKITHILCPERADINKWLEYRKKIILKIQELLPDSRFHFLEIGDNIEDFKQWTQENKVKCSWFWFLPLDELHKKIHNTDLVLWIFNNGALSMSNMETMILKTPLITYDKWWSIKIDNSNILKYTEKMISDYNFRMNEVQKNYDYVIKNCSPENYKKIFTTFL